MSEDTKRDRDLLLRSVSRAESDDSESSERAPVDGARGALVRVVSRVERGTEHGDAGWVAMHAVGRVSLPTEYELTLVPGPDTLQ